MSYTSILNQLTEIISSKGLSEKEFEVAISGLHTSAVLTAARKIKTNSDVFSDDSINHFMEVLDSPGEESDAFIEEQVTKLLASDSGEFQQAFEEQYEKLLNDFLKKVQTI